MANRNRLTDDEYEHYCNCLALIDKLKFEPLDFTLADAHTLTLALDEGLLPQTIIHQTAIEVLDLSPKGIFRSGAADGLVGWVNGQSRARRQERFRGIASSRIFAKIPTTLWQWPRVIRGLNTRFCSTSSITSTVGPT